MLRVRVRVALWLTDSLVAFAHIVTRNTVIGVAVHVKLVSSHSITLG